ncbi:hypothetical protein EUX98_g4526 [Antrodiella citrinella]|uniref:Tyrosine specific protein phosphatases domain-containing protein n=1 Tax=Antrodiella citrinella TaxID=2447956 RepID=A0A4S4N1S0_9APHY|nr:hypothetical protein EUX98_g4526 [Antrodiella citrinella]
MDLEPLDPEYVQDRLSRAPFVNITGVDNVRDLGSYPTSYAGYMTKPSYVLRGAEISSITEEGKERLKKLGVTRVYDLRSDTEIAKWGTASPDMGDLEIIRTPVFKTEDYSPEMMAKRFELYASGKTEAFMQLYSQILDNAGPAFGVIFRHSITPPSHVKLSFPGEAGKDRTGVLAALLLSLAGVREEDIAEDYALTRVGREPSRAKVMARLSKEPIFAANSEAALNMFTSRPETMLAFLQLVQEKYGGAEGYLKQHAQLTDEDITTIRRNILVPTESSRL